MRRFAADAEELRGSLEAGSGCFFVTRYLLTHLITCSLTNLLTHCCFATSTDYVRLTLTLTLTW